MRCAPRKVHHRCSAVGVVTAAIAGVIRILNAMTRANQRYALP